MAIIKIGMSYSHLMEKMNGIRRLQILKLKHSPSDLEDTVVSDVFAHDTTNLAGFEEEVSFPRVRAWKLDRITVGRGARPGFSIKEHAREMLPAETRTREVKNFGSKQCCFSEEQESLNYLRITIETSINHMGSKPTNTK